MALICFFLTLILWSNCLANLKVDRRLRRNLGDSPLASKTTVVIPVRDEEVNLRAFLPRLIDQRARPFEVLLLDDQSTDGTANIIDSVTQRHPWIRRLQGKPLPEGWQGKVWAIEQLRREVKTPYLLSLDADVRLEGSLTLGSLFKTIETESQWEKGFYTVFPAPTVSLGASLLVFQIHTYLYYFLPALAHRFARLSANAVAGCGQIMFFSLASLEKVGGLTQIKSSTHDGLQLSRLFRQHQLSVSFGMGGELFTSETYPDFRAAFLGFSRNSFEAAQSGAAALGLTAINFLVFLLPFLKLGKLSHEPLWALTLLMVLHGQYRLAKRFGFPLSFVILTPLRALASIAVQVWGLVLAKTKRKSQWRGREIVIQ